MANRAKNALHRPTFIGAIAVATFVTSVVSMVVAPRTRNQPIDRIPVLARPDTLDLAVTAASSRVSLAKRDSTLASSRARADSIAALPPDPAAVANRAVRDSLVDRVQRLENLMARAAQAPLPASYTALASTAELRADPRTQALVDSLKVVAQDRDEIGAAGGVDPVFVALTTRMSELGRQIEAIAMEHRNALLAQASALVAESPVTESSPVVDTVALVASRDSARAELERASAELGRRRTASMAMDREETRLRERAMAVAPPLALLAAAFVLSAVVGFGVAFTGELRRPRVSDAMELERWLGVRVLSTVETPMPSVDRGRREADRAAPPYFDPNAEGYQLAYLGLATTHPSLLMATVTGDDPAIAAVVACNLAAVAVDEARHALVVDLDPSRFASSALQARVAPGVAELLRERLPWPDTVVSARAGRDRMVDLIPFGAASGLTAAELVQFGHDDLSRLARYYDAVILLATAEQIAGGLTASLPSPELVYCAQPGITPIRQLREELDRMREAGAVLRGIVLWAAERPLLQARHEAPRRLTLSA